MRQGRNLEQLIAEIERQANAKRDFIAPVGAIEMHGTNGRTTLHINGREGTGNLDILDHTHDQIGSYLDIPGKFYDRLNAGHPELLATNVNTLLRAHKGERRMVRTLGGTARAFLSNSYRHIENVDMMRHILPVLFDRKDLMFASAEITDRRVYLKVICTELEGEVRQGDVVRAGAIVQNSEVGAGSWMIAPFTEVLRCTNGMTHISLGQRKSHLGRALGNDDENVTQYITDEARKAEDQAFFLKARDLITGILQPATMQRLLTDMRAAAADSITGDPVAAVDAVAVGVGLNEMERGDVLSNLIKGADLSRWGMVNAITRTAQDSAGYDRASELERIGGDLLHTTKMADIAPAPVRVRRVRKEREVAAV